MRPLRVLGLGDNTVDTYVDRGRQFPGGNAVNVAVLMQRTGAQAAYLGCIGNDGTGALVHRALLAEGLDLSHCRRPDGPNARAFIAHDQGERRFIRSEKGVRGAWGRFSADDLAYIGGFDLVHSSIFSDLDDHLPVLRRHIRRLSFDFSERRGDDRLDRLLPLADCAFLSFAHGSDGECEALLRRCARLGPSHVVITRGARGAMALRDGTLAACLPAPVAVVDTLGAGDAFIAAHLIADHAGLPLSQCLQGAAQAAARACIADGAFGHGADWTPSLTDIANVTSNVT